MSENTYHILYFTVHRLTEKILLSKFYRTYPEEKPDENTGYKDLSQHSTSVLSGQLQ